MASVLRTGMDHEVGWEDPARFSDDVVAFARTFGVERTSPSSVSRG
jgi:hypothetical protein